jgi:hypothetical protein
MKTSDLQKIPTRKNMHFLLLKILYVCKKFIRLESACSPLQFGLKTKEKHQVVPFLKKQNVKH